MDQEKVIYTSTPSPISPWVRWVIPALLMVFCLASEVVVPNERKPAFFSEGGPVEGFQEVILIVALIAACGVLWRVKTLWLRVWFGIATVATFFVLGEEISWGQTLFNWATPELWGTINDQNETNLHNTSAWLDQKPKILLQIGVLIGGLIIPALLKWKPSALPVRYVSIYPSAQVSIVAGFGFAVKLADTIQDRIDQQLFWRASEVLEIYIYYFVMIYLVEMWKRFKPAKL